MKFFSNEKKKSNLDTNMYRQNQTYSDNFCLQNLVWTASETLSKRGVANYPFAFQGQQKDNEIYGEGNAYTAMFWEYDPRLGRRWNLDPKPQINISNYVTFRDCPIWLNDPFGDEVDITHRKGFLGLGKKETLKYENGKLYNKDGSEYTGKVRGFLKQTVKALDNIDKTDEGCLMLSELESSKNIFTIQKGSKNQFVANNIDKAYANQWATDPSTVSTYQAKIDAGTDFSGGSGGTIYFNPRDASMWEQGGNYVKRENVALGHELFHGLDANRGLMDSRPYLGVARIEWQAVYRENIMRQQMGIPLRTKYISNLNLKTKILSPAGPDMLDSKNYPILPSWYKH